MGLCRGLFPTKGETLHYRVAQRRGRRRAAIVALCSTFAVVPILALLHRTAAGPVSTRLAVRNAVDLDASRLSTSRATSSDPAGAVRDPQPATSGTAGSSPSIAAPLSNGNVVAAGVSATTGRSSTSRPLGPRPPGSTTKPSTTPVGTRPVSTTIAPRPVSTAPPTTTPVSTTVLAQHEDGQATWLDTIPTGTCANNEAPMGETITVVSRDTGASVTCKVVSRGPFWPGRIVDLAVGTFAQLAAPSIGVINVTVSW